MEDLNDEATRTPSRNQTGFRTRIAWGVVDQGLSSATNFALSLFAARLLGASGLGTIAIGFSAYLVTLGFQRSLFAEPAVIASSAESDTERDRVTRSVVGASIVFACLTAVALAVVGLVVGGRVGRGLLIFAPWVLPALIQDLWRMLLFRDGRGFAAACTDGVWLAGMLMALPAAWNLRADWAMSGCWGVGATFGAAVGFFQLRTRTAAPRTAWAWATAEAWPVGRWFAAEGAVYTAASQFVIFFVAGLLGAQAVGGLRSVQVLFAPFALLGPAFALPGLPLITRALQRSPRAAWKMALKLSTLLAVLAFGYLLASLVAGEHMLSAILGPDFARYSSLIWPLGTQQVLAATSSGFFILLKAARRGKALLVYRTIVSLSTVAAVIALTVPFRLLGAAWGVASATAIGSVILIILCWPHGPRQIPE